MQYSEEQYQTLLTSVLNIIALSKELAKIKKDQGDKPFDPTDLKVIAVSEALSTEILTLGQFPNGCAILMDAVNNSNTYDFLQYQKDAVFKMLSTLSSMDGPINMETHDGIAYISNSPKKKKDDKDTTLDEFEKYFGGDPSVN